MKKKKIKIVFIIFILIIAFFINNAVKTACNVSANRIYEQGMQLYNLEKYQDAYYNFKKVSKFSNLYQLALIKQYQCAINLADKKTAHSKVSELSKITHDTNVRPWALYNEANLAYELGMTSSGKSYRKFKQINSQYPKNDFGVASAYKMAKLAQNKNPKAAKIKYLEYLNYAPTGKFAIYALDNVTKIKLPFTDEEYELIANSNLINERYKEALDAYKHTSFSKNWFNISKCYRGLLSTSLEKDTILKGLDESDSQTDEKDIDAAIERYIAIQNLQKDKALEYLKTRCQDKYAFPTVMYKLAEISSKDVAISYYKLVKDGYPNSIWASNSLWETFWYNYNLDQFETCLSLYNAHQRLYPKTQDAPRVMYWMAKMYAKNHKNGNAKELYNKVINNYPLSYYAFSSAKQLKISKSKKRLVRKAIGEYDINNLNKYLFKNKLLIQLVKRQDFKTIEELRINDEFIKSRTYFAKELYPSAINAAMDEINKQTNVKDSENGDTEIKINFSNFELKLAYPILYEKEINKYAKEVKQSPYLFLSLIREESHFDKNAKSKAGAMGLSQIMSGTAKYIENREISTDILFDVEENIKIGLKYFNYLVDYYNKNEYLAILAYNAGPGSIDKWMNNPEIANEDVDAFVENIPYLETKNYIKKILSSYWVYLNIYSPSNK